MMQTYNLFFYPNMCHVCKHFGKRVILKRCGNCTMISYCSREHQRQHWPQHKDLCIAVSNVLRDNRTSSLLCDKENCTLEAWAQIKMNFMLLVGLTMTRKLEHYEEQMFKFLRACAVCHERNPKILEDCPNCPSASFCAKHKNDLVHKEICPSLNLCCDLDVTLMMHNQENIPEIMPYCTGEKSLPDNMRDFIKRFIQHQKICDLSTEKETALYAEYLTRPLTVLFAMQKLEYSNKAGNLIVHIIGANMIEMNGIDYWEIILHWLSSIRNAKIILVGPELTDCSIENNLCKTCILESKELSIETYGSLYENYAKSSSFVKPDFIIGFNAGIHECDDWESSRDTWVSSIRIIAKQNCPLVLTSYTLQEMEKEQIRLKLILGDNTMCTYCAQNPYSSLRPYRDFETNAVYYQNQYILVYNYLNSL